jgi:hypothetical protein
MKTDWCENENVHLEWLGFAPNPSTPHKSIRKLKKTPTRVRCHKCKKRFKPFVKECDDEGCIHLYLPKHKLKK